MPMANALLFVTVPNADHKVHNLILHDLKEWHDPSEGGYLFHLVTTKNAYMLEARDGHHSLGSTKPTFGSDMENPWVGASLADVEGFCLDLIGFENEQYNASIFVVVDEPGLKDGNAILCDRAWEEVDGEFVMLDKFNKVRIPFAEVATWWVNVELPNADFSAVAEKLEGEDGARDKGGKDGWHRYRQRFSSGWLEENHLKCKEEALQRLKNECLV